MDTYRATRLERDFDDSHENLYLCLYMCVTINYQIHDISQLESQAQNKRIETAYNNKYHLHEHELERVNSTKYLGVEVSENLTWNRHIAKTCNKATKTLSFLRRNLRVRNVQAKSLAYKVLVRPTLEYCCPVWDPHHKNQEYQLEIVQKRAARFVLGRYHNTSSVTDMLQQLKGALYRIQILCRRYTFWSYPAGLTIADPPDNKRLSIAESIHTTFTPLSPSLFTPHEILYSAPLIGSQCANAGPKCA